MTRLTIVWSSLGYGLLIAGMLTPRIREDRMGEASVRSWWQHDTKRSSKWQDDAVQCMLRCCLLLLPRRGPTYLHIMAKLYAEISAATFAEIMLAAAECSDYQALTALTFEAERANIENISTCSWRQERCEAFESKLEAYCLAFDERLSYKPKMSWVAQAKLTAVFYWRLAIGRKKVRLLRLRREEAI